MNLDRLFLDYNATGFSLNEGERCFLRHSIEFPLLYAGKGEATIWMNCGNFDIRDDIRELCALREMKIDPAEGELFGAIFSASGRFAVRMGIKLSGNGRLEISFSGGDDADRFRIVLPATASEHVYGCGEQFSYLDLRGRSFPLWTSEQGVGRNKSTRVTLEADLIGKAGGDYWWTFFPQPSFVSSSGYWCHMDSSAYSVFDFRRADRHELYSWALPERMVFGSREDMAALIEDQSEYFGRQDPQPDWTYDGIILGIQGGTDVCSRKLEKARSAGMPVSGIWAQDWEGINITSFGQRLRWDWVWNKERYPGLDTAIKTWKSEGVRFLAYANCYVGKDWSLCRDAAAKGYLVKNSKGEDYYVDFGEFYAGIPDLTNPEAFDWFADALVHNMIDLGMGGWMADFGEYLPTDAVLYDGSSALIAHNLWPALWAKCNYSAVRKAHVERDVFFFMRAGFTGSQRWCPVMWGGDQNVDWSQDDGLPSAVRSALSLAMSGHGVHHSDIGGYTTLFSMGRTKELFMRWAEQAAFSPLMRGHEGNRPKDNWQFDSDSETLSHLARMGRVHVALKPYLKSLSIMNAERGIPIMRPMFMEHPEDPAAWTIDSQYMLGADLLVAPVMEEGSVSRSVRVPAGEWKDFWTGKLLPSAHKASDILVEGCLGMPPVLVRASSPFSGLFEQAAGKA